MIGQMSIKKLSNECDYLQLDICGLNVEEAIQKYKNYNSNKKPIILHGDWEKRIKNSLKKPSENNIENRYKDYIDIANELSKCTKVLGITIHPPYRKKVEWDNFIHICDLIKQSNINVFVENRSSKKIYLSTGKEIIDYSQKHFMTIDIPQLYISCNYNEDYLIQVLKEINMNNVKEIHFANILRKEKHTFVGRKIQDGILDLSNIVKYLNKNAYYTLEILGGVNTFNNQKIILEKMKGDC